MCLLAIPHERSHTYAVRWLFSLHASPIYLSWLCRCYIMNKKTKLAWEQCVRSGSSHLLVSHAPCGWVTRYLKMGASNESFNLLQLIANDCYKVRPTPWCGMRVCHG